MNYKMPHQETLLVVDDVPANINVLLEILTTMGFKVLVAQDGKTALQRAEYTQPDLILLDIMMPNMNGFDVCGILKSQEKTQDIPVIFMTALADTEDKVKGFSLGAVDYITKPFQHEEVLARITSHLELRKLQKRLEEELEIGKKHAIELEKRNTALNAFTRTVAHELKNPLNGIMGFSEVLLFECSRDSLLKETLVEHLQLIHQSGKQLHDIIEALLLLARDQLVKTNTQPLEMSYIINEVLTNRLAYMCRQFQAEITLPESWPTAMGYAPWIGEVWANYLSNGLKYGGQPPYLKLGADIQNDEMIRFWVHDNGPGIDAKAKALLFEPFTRLHKNRAEGHGLGLSIVRQIVEKLGGNVGVESIEGQGSTFYFTLPQEKNESVEE
ncbi:hybrid sensor histidine kinase/response regulator [Candidatus Parabeggiatoa sp. HSG14]|uniref:hybrid sensor histidine kinase/response regulator n=1 Tax=Candidatus Parabeggiatoa sp. HSG14 TaxID=3055593 RepID=UPI0025A92C0A|nr:hybrid sensor histidine kinase/response regulator [Thiotrichales bacterium HSG14]